MTDLRARAESFLAAAQNASPAPWRATSHCDVWSPMKLVVRHAFSSATEGDADNADFIVAARNNAPALVGDLLAEVERLTTAMLRVYERAGIGGSNYEETLNDVDKILGTAILGGGVKRHD